MHGQRRASGELEAQVMAVLWASNRPLTAADVNDRVGAELAYNTVQTILARLTDKQLVHRAIRGRAHVYWPAKEEAEAVAARMRETLSSVRDREQALQQFAATLDEAEADVLRALLGIRPETTS
jgi:predicted transcriptional regulator